MCLGKWVHVFPDMHLGRGVDRWCGWGYVRALGVDIGWVWTRESGQMGVCEQGNTPQP